jgi:nucleoside-diphosphate-sugar epimerase
VSAHATSRAVSAPGEGTLLFGGSGFLGSAVLEQAPGMVSAGRTAPPVPNRHVHIDSTADLTALEDEDFDSVVFAVGSSAHHVLADERPLPGGPTPFDHHLSPLLETLEQLKRRKLRRFVHFSTALLYDERRAPAPFAEDAPTDPYRDRHVFAKHLAEEALRFYARWIPSTNVRLASLYGPTRGDGRDLVHQLCRQLVEEGRARMVSAAGERDFVHVEDAARAVVALLDAGHDGTVNLGTGSLTPVSLVRDVLQEVSGAEIDVLGRAAGEPRTILCDAGLLRRLTGWEPRWGVADGVRSTYERMLALST